MTKNYLKDNVFRKALMKNKEKLQMQYELLKNDDRYSPGYVQQMYDAFQYELEQDFKNYKESVANEVKTTKEKLESEWKAQQYKEIEENPQLEQIRRQDFDLQLALSDADTLKGLADNFVQNGGLSKYQSDKLALKFLQDGDSLTFVQIQQAQKNHGLVDGFKKHPDYEAAEELETFLLQTKGTENVYWYDNDQIQVDSYKFEK